MMCLNPLLTFFANVLPATNMFFFLSQKVRQPPTCLICEISPATDDFDFMHRPQDAINNAQDNDMDAEDTLAEIRQELLPRDSLTRQRGVRLVGCVGLFKRASFWPSYRIL